MKIYLHQLNRNSRNGRTCTGAVLMEVVFSVLLFAAAGAVIAGAMSASMSTLDRVRAGAYAENLAISILSQVQMGVVPATAAGPEVFEPPFDNWTWELAVEPVAQPAFEEAKPLLRVEVVVRQLDGVTVRRLVHWLPEGNANEEDLPL